MTIRNKSPSVKDVHTTNIISRIDLKSDKHLYVSLFLFSMFAGGTWPAGKIIAQNISPIGAAFYRYLLALPLFITLSRINKSKQKTIQFDKSMENKIRLHLQLVGLGFIGVALYTVLFLEGLKCTSASDGTMIFAMVPTLTVIIANFVIPEDRITMNKLLGLVSGLIGVGMIFLESPNKDVPNRLIGN